MRLKAITLLIIAALGGCATCRTHPVACTVAVGVVATSVALSAGHHRDEAAQRTGPICAPYCAIGR